MDIHLKYSLQRFGSDGKSVVLKDDTEGYGEGSNPLREELALVFYNWLRGENGDTLQDPAIYYIQNFTYPSTTPTETVADPITANAVRLFYPQDGVYKIAAVLLPLTVSADNTLGEELVGKAFYDAGNYLPVICTAAIPQGDGTYSYTFASISPENLIDNEYANVATSESISTYDTTIRLQQLLHMSVNQTSTCCTGFDGLAQQHIRLWQPLVGVKSDTSTGRFISATQNLAKINEIMDSLDVPAASVSQPPLV